jgi:threonine dehydratase
MDGVVTLADVFEARRRLTGIIRSTPLESVRTIDRILGLQVFFKMENLQRTGSFKIRGAFNKILRLPAGGPGVVAASAGNHAQGVALAAAGASLPALVVMPRGTPRAKVRAAAAYGARVILAGRDYWEAGLVAARLAAKTGARLIPAFDDPEIIAGQGTIGFEILESLPDVDAVLVPTGGGGLLSGVALVIKSLKPDTRIVGVAVRAAPALFFSHRSGAVREVPVHGTLADGIAVKRPGELTFRYIRQLVDDMVLVNEQEIATAIRLLLFRAKTVVEGAGAVGLAALLAGRVGFGGRRVAVILTGGNIDGTTLARAVLTRKKLAAGQDSDIRRRNLWVGFRE